MNIDRVMATFDRAVLEHTPEELNELASLLLVEIGQYPTRAQAAALEKMRGLVDGISRLATDGPTPMYQSMAELAGV